VRSASTRAASRRRDHPELPFFREWLDRGYAGEMAYLHRTADAAPTSATSCLGAHRHRHRHRLQHRSPYSTECADPDRAQIARYAWGDDYHDVIGARLESLLAWMRDVAGAVRRARLRRHRSGAGTRLRAARRLGWIGKNTCVINPQLGSWMFLGAIICSLPLAVDAPSLDQCGTCTLCLEACPTQALVAPGVLDSTRCISYLTIELRGDDPGEHAPAIGSHVYGCDICQEVCPWNAVAPRRTIRRGSRGRLGSRRSR
jgi:epoxyqueuosine reductase